MNNTIKIEVMRYHPDRDDKPWVQAFDIEWTKDMSILDALQLIKDEQEPELSYRWSCRMEVCGSCGMVVNGVPKLACSTFVRDYADVGKITIGAMDNFPIEKDLVVDVQPFIDKLESVNPYIVNKNRQPPKDRENLQTPAQLAKFKPLTMCINCMLCYQACPQVAITPKFLGPAATAMAMRYNLDNRDDGNHERYEVMNKKDTGIWACTFVGYCSEVCPKHVDPAGAVQQAKTVALPVWGLDIIRKKKKSEKQEQLS